MDNIHDEVLRIVQESQLKQVQENTIPLLLEIVNLFREIVLTQWELLQIYDTTLPKALLAFIPKEPCSISALTPEQRIALDALQEYLQRKPVCERLQDLMVQAAEKYQDVQYLSEIANNQ